MEEVFDAWLEDICAGQVYLKKEGLFYCINCRINPPAIKKYRLTVRNEDMEYDLGLFVPCENGMVITTRIPEKRFLKGNIKFNVVKDQRNPQKVFVPICAEEPFAYIDKLDNTTLAKEKGKIGVYMEI